MRINLKLKVAYSADNLPQGKVTIAPSSYSNLASDVQTGGVSVTSALEIDPGNSEGGSDATDWNVGTTYENILYTWTKPSGNWKTGSIPTEEYEWHIGGHDYEAKEIADAIFENSLTND